MTVRTNAYLKTRFENGDFPDQTDFGDMIDTMTQGVSGSTNRWTQEILGTGNGVLSAFPFSHTPASSATTFLFANGIFQNITIDWNLQVNQAVFTVVVPNGWVISSFYSY